MTKKEPTTEYFLVENYSKIRRAASGTYPDSTNKMASLDQNIVYIEIGMNLFTKAEMDIIKSCFYTKGKFGLDGWLKEFPMFDNLTDVYIQGFVSKHKLRQKAILEFLYDKASSLDLKSKIKDMIPREAVKMSDKQLPATHRL